MIRFLLILALLFGITQARAASCTPSPSNTVIQNGGGGTILDAACNKWTVTGGVVSENGALAGYSANVTALAVTGGVIWQVNNSSPPQWYDWLPSSSTWGPPGGTAVSPLPVAPPPAAGLTTAQKATIALVTADQAKLLADAETAGNDLTKFQTDFAAMIAALGAQ